MPLKPLVRDPPNNFRAGGFHTRQRSHVKYMKNELTRRPTPEPKKKFIKKK